MKRIKVFLIIVALLLVTVSFVACNNTSDGMCAHTSITDADFTVVVSATCARQGIQWAYCPDCGVTIERYYGTTTSNHQFSDWITETEPTCIECGTFYRYCEVCHSVYERKNGTEKGPHSIPYTIVTQKNNTVHRSSFLRTSLSGIPQDGTARG